MWNKNRARTDLQRFAGKTSLLAVGAELQGDLRFQGAVQIDGVLKGNLLTSEGMVRISEQGRVEGEIRAPHIIVDGEVQGDVHASSHLELGPRARIRGNLYYAVMEMAMGAQVEGRLCRLQEESRPLELPQSLAVPE
ncbi:polymer-forming cytoskeletal protein [Pseudomonas sp. 5P_3.1_Bac2]|uniref:bactofilin family protein n=1 Tax=Pseudomonas sp. 5P_3.1_Bac2 TaxID=2971617 RepID=UPI0021C5D611|nr:polymer-forming cytoskeletal protein [Pseudomonas sp. 5P_3.1_Bac2]MCU1717494.1 polymer-forming cytoskeletal protein [Pseudomonas sp. 5P_3.1_Bac2]